MSFDPRRVSVIALVLLAIVAVSLVIRAGAGRMPLPIPGGTVATGSTPPSAARTGAAPVALPAAGAGDPAPTSTDLVATSADPALPADLAPLPPAPASVDRDLDLSGVVVNSDGAPVEGATVQAVFHPARSSDVREASPWGVLGPATRSGADGEFAVRLLRGQRAGLRVTAAGFAPFERGPATAGDRLRVVVRPAVTCVVTLRDPQRRPVAGRTVRLQHPATPLEVLLDREGVSDGQGCVRFDDLPGGLLVSTDPALARPSPPAPARVALPLRGTVEVEVFVPSGRALHGRVTDSRTGLPIRGARVRLSIAWRDQATQADADGRYSFPSVPEPAQAAAGDEPPQEPPPRLAVKADGYVTTTAPMPAGDVCDVSLAPAETLTGRAVDGAGKPIAQAWVFLTYPPRRNSAAGLVHWNSTPAAMTAYDGSFRVSTQARYGSVRVEAVSFAPLDHGVEEGSPRPRSIDVGDLVLAPGRMLQGRVSDGEGRPMPGVRVSVDEETCTSDDMGRYRVRDLTPGRHHIPAYADGGRDQIERSVTLAPGTDPAVLDLAFPAGREVTIDVRDEGGVPIARAGLAIVGRRIWHSTDAQGRGVVVLPSGAWKARVAAGYARHADGRPVFVPRVVEIPADATLVVVTLERAPQPEDMLPVAGTVVDGDGRPVGGVFLSVTWDGREDPSRRAERVRSREDGRFEVRIPRGAVCDIRVHSRVVESERPWKVPPSAPWEGELTGVPAGRTGVVIAGRTGVVVAARPDPGGRAVTVLVLAPDGAPLADADVRLSQYPGKHVKALTGKDGRAVLSGLFRVSCSASVDPPEQRKTEWQPGHSHSFVPDGQEITVRLRRAAEIAGTVLFSDGSPARNTFVTFTAGSTRRDEWVDQAGRFRLRVDATLPLPWRLTAGLGGNWPPIETSVDLTAPPTEDVILRLPEPAVR